MATVLQPAPIPLSLDSGYIVKEECTLRIECPDRNIRAASVFDETGTTIFTLQAKDFLKSWSLRRSLRDSHGHHILDLRHHKSRLREWVVEDPHGSQFCVVKDSDESPGKITMADAQIITNKGDASMRLRSFDHAGTITVFYLEGIPVAEMSLTENNDVTFLKSQGLMRSVWKLRIAGGVDMALVLALAFCRVEVSHAWRR